MVKLTGEYKIAIDHVDIKKHIASNNNKHYYHNAPIFIFILNSIIVHENLKTCVLCHTR